MGSDGALLCKKKREREMTSLSLFLYNIPHKRFGLLQFRLRLIQKKDFPPQKKLACSFMFLMRVVYYANDTEIQLLFFVCLLVVAMTMTQTEFHLANFGFNVWGELLNCGKPSAVSRPSIPGV